MRGLAVLIMIEAHLLDSWTAAPYRESREFMWAILMSLSLHKALTFRSALLALAGFTLLMLACSMAKDRAVTWWRGRVTS
jgi:hypothetical protein